MYAMRSSSSDATKRGSGAPVSPSGSESSGTTFSRRPILYTARESMRFRSFGRKGGPGRFHESTRAPNLRRGFFDAFRLSPRGLVLRVGDLVLNWRFCGPAGEVGDPDRVQRHEADEPQHVAQDDPDDGAGGEPQRGRPVVEHAARLGAGSLHGPFAREPLRS